MSFIHVFEYIAGLGVFGMAYWLLNGIVESIEDGTNPSGDVYNLYMYVWVGAVIMYLIFGGIWVARKYAEKEYQGGNKL
jgi:hypothetical protein